MMFGEMVQMDGTAIPAALKEEPPAYCLQARPWRVLPDRGAAYETAARQKFAELTRFTHCSFTDEWDIEQSEACFRGSTYGGVKDSSRKNDPTFIRASIVTIQASLLRAMCEFPPGTLTPAETSLLRFDSAITVRKYPPLAAIVRTWN